MSSKRSKKEVKKKNFYLYVFDQIKLGKSPSNIANSLNISKQRVNYYINKLKKEGYISKKGYGVWEILKEVKKSSLGTMVEKPKINLHALQINIPILKGKIKDNDWEIKEKLNNWIPKYKKLDVLGGLRFKNNNNKSITIFAESRDIKDLNEVNNLCFKIKTFVTQFMKNKQGVIIDPFNAKVSNLNLSTQDKKAESMIRKGEKFELDLNKKSEKIFPKDNINAKAWIDGSPFKFSAETNDLEWKRAYLQMPFMMRDMMQLFPNIVQNLDYVAKNYKSHAEVVVQAKQLFKKINKQLSQKSLKEFF